SAPFTRTLSYPTLFRSRRPPSPAQAPVAWRRRPRPSGSPAAFPAFPAHLPFPALLFLPSVLLPRRRRRRPPILLPRRRRRRRRPLARSLSLPLLLQLAQLFALLGLRV